MFARSSRSHFLLIVLVYAVVVGITHAKIISVNLYNSTSGSPGLMDPDDLAGAPDVRVGNWNQINEENLILGDDETIVYDDGSEVEGVNIELETSYNFSNRDNNSSYDNDEIMFNGIVDNFEGTTTVTLTGLPFMSYDVYIYMRDDGTDRAGSFLHVGSGLAYHATGGEGNPSADGDGYVRSADTSIVTNDSSSIDGGNYVLFEGLSGDAVFEISATDTEASHLRNKWAGFQIVGDVDRSMAKNPVPDDGATDVSQYKDLAWIAGPNAQTHDIYLGSEFVDVNTADRTNHENVIFRQDHTQTTYIPNDPLSFGQTYYWRVDEVNGAPDYTIHRGTVWSFTVEPVAFEVTSVEATASDYFNTSEPNMTVNGSGLTDASHNTTMDNMWISIGAPNPWIQYEFEDVLSLHQMKVWNANTAFEVLPDVGGMGVQEANIEISVDGESWTSLDDPVVFNQASGMVGYEANTTIDFDGIAAKYVKINVINNWGNAQLTVGLSEVRFYRIPTAARLPVPEDGQSDVLVTEILNWRSGRYAASHEVYLGTDVNSLTMIETVTDSFFETDALVYGETYTWRVDEVNETRDIVRYKGDLWTFSTAEYRLIDDMESYDDEYWIYSAWDDGYDDQDDDNSSQVGHDDSPYVEQKVVYAGSQSMPLYYNNEESRMVATAVLRLDNEDWTEGGLQILTLFFRGQWDNDGGELYVQINDKKVVCETSLSLDLWTQWNIDLVGLDINLTDVQSLTIGIDGVGEGLLYIDEIRLYHEAPVVVVSSDPGDADLALYYNMNSDVADHSGQGLDGTAQGSPIYRDSLPGFNQAMEFDGIGDWVDLPVGDLVANLGESSYSAWVQIDDDATGNWMRIFDFGTDTTNYMFLSPRSGTSGSPEFGIISTPSGTEQDVAASVALSEGWHHLAVVIQSSDLSLYVDGTLAGTDATNTLPQDLGVTTQNWLGQSQWSGDDLYEGMIDEFRIYSRALSASEVRYLAGDQ